MDKVAQRIAIAIACGWRKTPFSDEEYYLPTWRGEFTASDPLKSLDAMAEAEKWLNTTQVIAYDKMLLEVLNNGTRVASWDRCSGDYTWNLPAEKRAEAYLKTIGKWVDSK